MVVRFMEIAEQPGDSGNDYCRCVEHAILVGVLFRLWRDLRHRPAASFGRPARPRDLGSSQCTCRMEWMVSALVLCGLQYVSMHQRSVGGDWYAVSMVLIQHVTTTIGQ